MMRKRSRRQGFKQASPHTDSPTPSCFPLFSVLFITWIALLTLNPIFTHNSGPLGSFSWSFTWLNGVRADRNNGDQKVQEIGFTSNAKEGKNNVSALNQTTHKATITADSKQSLSVRNLKCRSSFKEVFFCQVLLVCCSSSGGLGIRKGKGIQGLCSDLNLVQKDVGMYACAVEKQLISSQPNGGSDEYPQQFHVGCDEEGHLHDVPENHIDGDIDDCEGHHTYGLLGENTTHGHIDDGPEHHTHGQINGREHCIHGHVNDDGGLDKHGHIDDGEEHHMHGHPAHNDAVSNDTESAFVTSEMLNKTRPVSSKIHLRQEPGDGPYNYASESKGAKILASNKEAKGASNILNKDKDKYFRTPCNVETKYVDMELSEETLVVEIAIANHEFYSSNVRKFELWGSLTYPTEEWVFLGKFEAENCRVSQTFALSESQWVRYLKIQMLSHYGSDFYCTLSVVEVYGVDAIEWLLEDWIAAESETGVRAPLAASSFQEESSLAGDVAGPSIQLLSHVLGKDTDLEGDIVPMPTHKAEDLPTEKAGESSERKGENVEKAQSVYHQTGRPAVDAVMKLLMQKVRSLEHNQPLLSQYLEELDERYREVLRGYNKELAVMTGKLEGAATEIANLIAWVHFMEGNWNQEKHSLEKDILNQVKAWNVDLDFLRNQLRRTENKELVALAVAFFSIIIVVGFQMLMLCVSLFKLCKQNKTWLLTCRRALWVLPFLSCSLVVFVLSL